MMQRFCLNCKHFSVRESSLPLRRNSFVDCARSVIKDMQLWKILRHDPDSVFYKEDLSQECDSFEPRPLEELVAEKLLGRWKIPDDGKLGGEELMRELDPELFNPTVEEEEDE